ncbi:Protein FAR1-RELATED SEQUENCE 5 [Glycine soja]
MEENGVSLDAKKFLLGKTLQLRKKKLVPWRLAEDVFRETPRKKQSSAVVISIAEDCFFRGIILNVILVEMDEDQWTYYSAMSEEVDMDFQNEEEDCGVNEAHVDCSDAFNTSQVFETREDVLKWARTVAHENGFVAIRGKPVHRGEGWAVKLICGIQNHELAKTLVGHPYAGRLTDDEKNIIADMTKSNVKPRNILLTLKEHNSSSCTTIKQIYNARSAYRSSIRGDDSEMQHLMRLLERDQYIHWHRLKDEDVVRDLFWCHPDAVNTYKTNRYRLPLLDIVGVTPTGMTFSAGFAYLEGERVNNLVWALERDLALMNAVKVVFPECKNLLCRFHIDKNVKTKCKSLVGQKNAWDYEFPEHLQRFQVACSPWPMFIDYVCETWIVPHKEKFILAWTNKLMHLGNTTTNRVESAHWSLKRILQNSVGDLCSVGDAMNNMMTLQHTEIRASFETKTLYKRLLGMVSRYALNEISVEFERVRYLKDNVSSCGCVLRTTLGFPCTCELQRYEGGSIPLDAVHMYWRRLNFSDQGLCEAEVSIKEEMDRIYKRFDELDQHLNQTQCIIFCTTEASKDDPHVGSISPFMHGFIEDVVDVKADGNCGYRSVSTLLGMGEECWAMMRNELIKELDKWSQDYIKIFGGTERYEQLRLSLHVDGLSKVSMDKWMDITNIGYVIASRYNVILVSLSRQQSFTFFPLRSRPPANSSAHRIICVGHVFLKDRCPLPPMALLWSSNAYPEAKQWPTAYVGRMQQYLSLMTINTTHVDLSGH